MSLTYVYMYERPVFSSILYVLVKPSLSLVN